MRVQLPLSACFICEHVVIGSIPVFQTGGAGSTPVVHSFTNICFGPFAYVWLKHRPVTAEQRDRHPQGSFCIGLAQPGERLPYKQMAGGSSPPSDIRRCSPMAGQLICNQPVAGSSPVSGLIWGRSAMGEHLPCKQKVESSNLFGSIMKKERRFRKCFIQEAI